MTRSLVLFVLLVDVQLKYSLGLELGVIAQDGQSSTCAQTYYEINPDTCACSLLGCPASSKGMDPQIKEFATNAVIDSDGQAGNYIYIDQYWHYIQQISANGTQLNSPNDMVTMQCFSDDPTKGKLYAAMALQYDYSQNVMYGLINIPNDETQTYDAKISSLDPTTGECVDVVDNIIGSGIKWPSTCCGEASGPAYDQSSHTFYAYGANGYAPYPNTYTLLAVDIPAKKYAIGFLPSSIYIAQGFLFFDSKLGLHALGYVKNTFGIYRLQPWEHMGNIIAELVVDNITTRGPSGWTYDNVNQRLHMVYDDYGRRQGVVATLDMQTLSVTSCDLPSECTGNIMQWPVILNR